MKYLSLCVLALGLLAGPALAVTRDQVPGTQAAPPRQGTVNASGAVESGARAYTITSTSQVFDRKGAPLAASRLARGRSVAFTASADSTLQVRQLWLLD